ncbi:hypothetical protein K461DRAFT_55284 [Myriangium duriaei CBS 260.36]|uniref:Uncharacterized protein n=1 Tax=Myriangium duriaei CBS 260.36 TaxID=1168546 RepID=A0A9P4MDI8_9PEZI|nr:hypothetical protein K461DRAFT_55284 [Myriangium duriaei CBS 260.36]
MHIPLQLLFLTTIFWASTFAANPTPSNPDVEQEVVGVGFSLSHTHGAAAAHFPNGSTISVAHIPGTPGYKSYMRSLPFLPPSTSSPPTSNGSLTCPRPPPFRLLWPTSPLPSPASLIDLLTALKSATESTLAHPVTTVQLPLPFSASLTHDTHAHAHIRAALAEVGVTRSLPLMQDNVHAALVARGYDCRISADECSDAAAVRALPGVVMVVEYSEVGMGVVVLKKDDGGVYLEVKTGWDWSVGVEEMERCWVDGGSGAVDGVEGCERRLRETLWGMTRSTDRGWFWFEGVDALILMGEKGADPALRRAVEWVLRKRYPTMDVERLLVDAESVDPRFIAARGAAQRDLWARGLWPCRGEVCLF